MDILSVSQSIETKIKSLELGRELLRDRAENKAQAISEYDKYMAIALIQLKNGVEFEFEGEKIQKPPASIMEKIAKGICFQHKLDMELAEAQYKNAIVGMSAIQAELNGFQSIYRHLEQRG